MKWIAALTILFTPHLAISAEPYFCHPDNFMKLERRDMQSGENRLRVFQIGKLKLVGMAIGDSETSFVDSVAERLAQVPRSEKSCTWYMNKGNADAESRFNHAYVPMPAPWTSIQKIADQYIEVIAPHFAENDINIVNCATKYNYVAFGCNGQKHRGPSTIAMFLSVAGCSPENTAKIAKRIWGSNHVSSEHRTAISERGQQLALENPTIRRELQKVMLSSN